MIQNLYTELTTDSIKQRNKIPVNKSSLYLNFSLILNYLPILGHQTNLPAKKLRKLCTHLLFHYACYMLILP